MYDDIATNPSNPNPGLCIVGFLLDFSLVHVLCGSGVIINQPDGPNVYAGVVKDYTGNDVTPGNLIKVCFK